MDESCIELIELALRVISKVQLIEGVASDLSSAYSDDDAHTDALDSFDFETLHPSLVESRVQLFMDTDQLSDIMVVEMVAVVVDMGVMVVEMVVVVVEMVAVVVEMVAVLF